MLHYVHQLVANCVCQFGIERVMYTRFPLKIAENNAVRVNQNSKVVGQTAQQ